MKRRDIKDKKSYGITCVRWNSDKHIMEILMVKKRYTYSFVEFILGRYDINRPSQLKSAFNHMTIDEKHLILSGDFSKMWYYVWGYDPNVQDVSTERNNFYYMHKKIFYNKIPDDRREEIEKYITDSRNGDTAWEIPKGRLNPRERPLDCAIREFREETGISRQYYNLLYEIGTFTNTISTNTRRYISEYYVAMSCGEVVRNVVYDNEISDCRWMSIHQIREVCPNVVSNMVNRILARIKKYHIAELCELATI